MRTRVKHKILLAATLCLLTIGKKLHAQQPLQGTYKGFHNCEIASYTLKLKSNHKFEEHFSNHHITNGITKGTYSIKADTLSLLVNNNVYQIYLISADSLCRLLNVLCAPFCLKKQTGK